jgi:hypothetical protein
MATRGGKHEAAVAAALAPAVLEVVSTLPKPRVRKRSDPEAAARQLAAAAALKAALAAGALALPTGVLGWLALLPQLRAVWRIQAQLVVDIAALHGHRGPPTQEQMLHCLFQHRTARAMQALASGMGDRLLATSVSGRVLQLIAQRLAVRLTRAVVGRRMARLLPLAGAVGIGAYAYFETARVASTATALFQPHGRAA